jgi:hypothetical protein
MLKGDRVESDQMIYHDIHTAMLSASLLLLLLLIVFVFGMSQVN